MAQTGIHEAFLIGRKRGREVPPWLQGTLVALAVALSFGAIIWTIYWWSQNALISEINKGLVRTAGIAARSIDPEMHRTFTLPEQRDTEQYKTAAQPLADILIADPDIAYVWTAVRIEDRVHFILDGTQPPEPQVGVMEEYADPPADLLAAFDTEDGIVSKPYSDEWGTFVSAYMPFRDAQGTVVGVVGVSLTMTNYFERLHRIRNGSLFGGAIGISVAVMMGIGVWFNRKTDRTARDLARQLRTVNALLAVSRALGSGVNLDDLLPVIVKQTRSVMGARHGALFLYDEGSGLLRRSYVDGSAAAVDSMKPPTGLVGRVVRTRRPFNIANACADPEFDSCIDQRGDGPSRAMLLQPVIDRENHLLGVMQIVNKLDGSEFDRDDEILLGALGSQVVVALDRARLTQVYVEKQKMDEALKLAASIQMSMLSRCFPPPGQGAVEIHACLVPAKEVGGDFYDFFWLDKRLLAFLVADVSGKGIPAALFMAKAKTLVKSHANSSQDPEEILARANDDISIDNDNGMFVTLLLGLLDTETGQVHLANAGHNHAYRVSNRRMPVRVEVPSGIALGVMEGMPFESIRIQLEPGEALHLYTDGVNEAMDVDNQQFDYPRMEQVLQREYVSVADLDDAMLAAVREFADGTEQSDDITLLTVRWRGG